MTTNNIGFYITAWYVRRLKDKNEEYKDELLVRAHSKPGTLEEAIEIYINPHNGYANNSFWKYELVGYNKTNDFANSITYLTEIRKNFGGELYIDWDACSIKLRYDGKDPAVNKVIKELWDNKRG